MTLICNETSSKLVFVDMTSQMLFMMERKDIRLLFVQPYIVKHRIHTQKTSYPVSFAEHKKRSSL